MSSKPAPLARRRRGWALAPLALFTAPALAAAAPQTAVATAGHYLDRMTWGRTPTDMLALIPNQPASLNTFVFNQLHPLTIPETHPDFAPLIANIGLPVTQDQTGSWAIVDVTYDAIARSLFSQRQLNEVLTNFFSRHFNTFYPTVAGYFTAQTGNGTTGAQIASYFEWKEEEAFRTSATTSFYNMLYASATSPAMLVYLDGHLNVAGAPNENYARELLELHTLGVDGGYTETDVEEVARCFTGWTVCPATTETNPHETCGSGALYGFRFDPATHDYSQKTLFAGLPGGPITVTSPPGAGGIQDGLTILAFLANNVRTAEFVSMKLCRQFIDDDVQRSDPIVQSCATAWGVGLGGDLASTLNTIFSSADFATSLGNRRNRLKTAWKALASQVRVLDGRATTKTQLDSFYFTLRNDLAQRPFYNPAPDGHGIESDQQATSAQYLFRTKFYQHVFDDYVANPGNPYQGEIAYDPALYLVTYGFPLQNGPAMADLFLLLLTGGDYSTVDQQIAHDFIGSNVAGVPAPLDITQPDYLDRITHFMTYLASLPNHYTE